MREKKIKENLYAIVAIDASDVQHCSTIRILKNGIAQFECPADTVKKLGVFYFPDTAVIYDKNKDKITIERF